MNLEYYPGLGRDPYNSAVTFLPNCARLLKREYERAFLKREYERALAQITERSVSFTCDFSRVSGNGFERNSPRRAAPLTEFDNFLIHD